MLPGIVTYNHYLTYLSFIAGILLVISIIGLIKKGKGLLLTIEDIFNRVNILTQKLTELKRKRSLIVEELRHAFALCLKTTAVLSLYKYLRNKDNRNFEKQMRTYRAHTYQLERFNPYLKRLLKF